MNSLLFLIGVVVGAGAVWAVLQRKISELKLEVQRVEGEKAEEEEIARHFDEFNERMQEKQEERKGRIVEVLDKKDMLQRREVADLLEVSKKTAYNYLEELEQEGKIEQVGVTGRSVYYRLAE